MEDMSDDTLNRLLAIAHKISRDSYEQVTNLEVSDDEKFVIDMMMISFKAFTLSQMETLPFDLCEHAHGLDLMLKRLVLPYIDDIDKGIK